MCSSSELIRNENLDATPITYYTLSASVTVIIDNTMYLVFYSHVLITSAVTGFIQLKIKHRVQLKSKLAKE